MKKYEYDLVVIGSGPAGEKAAVKAAYFGYKVALVEKADIFGGAGVVSGTLPSKTLKETSLYFSGKYDKGLFGVDRDLQREASVEDFLFRKNFIIQTESEEVKKNLIQHGVSLYHGMASFKDEHTITVTADHSPPVEIQGTFILIATGSYPNHPSSIPFDGKRIHDSDTILEIDRFPHSMVILGAGVIGVEYATIFSTMGTKVYLINRNDKILTFVDGQIVAYFIELMKKDGIELLFNKAVKRITLPEKEEGSLAVELESSEVLSADMFLFAAGRNGNIKGLQLEKVGIVVDNRENIPVNEKYQTVVPHIYAVGDVIGFPALASTSMDQGRIAVAHMFQTKDLEQLFQVLPYGIYTVPEISTAGLSEEEAKKLGIDYCVGIARHADMPRGKIMGAKEGLLKLVFRRDNQEILGIHVIGHLATELVHHGITLIDGKKDLHYIIGRVYNYPTLHDLYKYAAYDGLGNLSGHKIKL